jgi:hypothetical protein
MLYTSANGTNWSSAFTSPPKDAFPLRPALIGDGTAVWMAWTFDDTSSSQTGPTVKVVRRTIVGTTTPLEAPVPKLSRHPFFARRGDLIALVYSKLDGTGTPMDIELAQVTYAGDTTPALTIAAGLGLSGATSASPDKPVVASGKNGFGVAWQEKVNGVDEVRFRWVGCRP